MKSAGQVPKIIQFKAVAQPGADYAFVPNDLHIIIPNTSRVSVDDRHYLAYLPWENRYLRHIPKSHLKFFKFVLPFLHARTSNVHTALSISQLPYLMPAKSEKVNERLVYLALILHDSGWSQVSTEGLVQSLSYNGVSPTSSASQKPKQQHLIYGEALAYTLLDAFDFGSKQLSSEEIYTIANIVRRHDNDAPWEKGNYGQITKEIQIVCDADRLWSYTRENFWLDTIRKAVPPEAYIEGIDKEINNYFFTREGKARAHQLIAERRREVKAHALLMQNPEHRMILIWQSRNPSRRIIYRTQQAAIKLKSRRLHRTLTRQTA